MPSLCCPDCLRPLFWRVKRGHDGRCRECRSELARDKRQRESAKRGAE